MSRKILQHVEAITQHRDTALLERSVVASLCELTGARWITLYSVLRLRGETYFARVAWGDAEAVHGLSDLPHEQDLRGFGELPEAARAVEQQEPATELLPESGYQRLWLPVLRKERAIACFAVEFAGAPCAQQLDIAHGILGLFRNYLALLEDSQQDTLTGLANRATFDSSLGRILSNLARPERKEGRERRDIAKQEHWLAAIDIDHFKRINDQFGHLYGDEVLILLANVMRSCFRQHDRLFRFGGEEFVVLLRHVDFEGARATLERFRSAVEAQYFPQVGRVTVSIGFSQIRRGDTPTIVLGQADDALYYAKEQGRNRVCCYDRLVENGQLARKASNTEAEFF